MFEKKISGKMTLIQGRGCPHQERLSITFFDSFSPSESEFFKQPAEPLGPKFLAAATDVPKCSNNDLQRILKAVLEAQTLAPTSAPAPTPTASKKPWNKSLKVRVKGRTRVVS